MYGKSFSRMYQGSMVGSGSHVYAVWGYCISCADPEEHTVDLNPVLLSAIIGDTVEKMKEAISYLCSPDPDSHCQDANGARLVHETGFSYFLVTHEAYRGMKNNEELREYHRENKRKQRAKKNVHNVLGQSMDPASASAYASVYVSLFSLPTFSLEWESYIEHRKNKKIKTTEHALELMLKRLSERPEQSIEALQECMIRGWTAFKWEWIDKDKQTGQSNSVEKRRELKKASECAEPDYTKLIRRM
jgi:hypothetical protein